MGSASDFDFLHGEWTTRQRRLRERLAGSDEWATPHWEQAFSADGGETWETNWTADFARAR
jgi:hypothetical protein